MSTHRPLRQFTALIFLMAFLTLSACQPVTTQEAPSVTEPAGSPTASTALETDSSVNPTAEITQESVEQTETQTSPASPTPAPTLADWREAPITPEAINDRILDIYAEGQKQGRNPAGFSVIGDCQSIPYVFMGPFGRGALSPDPAESHLWNAVNYFEESFDRWAVTARGGFTAASILNSLQADPEACKPGESPLTCEFRINNPAYVLITLETWLDPDTIDRYEVYLRKILDTVIERGAVPILLTKADSSELRDGTHILNPVVVRLAYEYQLPLVNFWRAAQYLDNYGIDPEREGFHLSEAGYKLKNILALRTLYQVWTFVESGGETAQVTESTPTPTPTEAAAPAPEVALPNCKAGDCVFFGTAQSRDGLVSAAGVYAYHVVSQTLTQVLGAGYDLQDVSEDGERLLVNTENYLYEVRLTDGAAELITDTFFFYGKQGAYWNADESKIISLNQDTPLQTDSGAAFTLIPNPGSETLVFESGACDGKDFCQSEGVFRQESGGEPEAWTGIRQPVFSPDGSLVAFLNPDAATPENYFHIYYLLVMETAAGRSTQRTLYFPAEAGFEVYPEVESTTFSPDGNQLLILYNVYSEYYERSLRLQTYLWDLQTGILYNFGKLEGVSASLEPRVAWSPDGDQLLFFLTDLTDEGETRISVYRTDLKSGEKLILADEAILTGTEYLYLTNLTWR